MHLMFQLGRPKRSIVKLFYTIYRRFAESTTAKLVFGELMKRYSARQRFRAVRGKLPGEFLRRHSAQVDRLVSRNFEVYGWLIKNL